MNLRVTVSWYAKNWVSVAGLCKSSDLAMQGINVDPAYLYLYFAKLQGAQAVGMGSEAQSVPAAADLYKKANDILG